MEFLKYMIASIFFSICYSREAPKLTPFIQSSSQKENSSFRLMCHSFAGTKPVFYQWNKNGLTLSNSHSNIYKIESFDDYSQFVIKSVVRSDSGNYSCIARNSFGTDIISTLLIVKVGPKWVKEPKDMVINADNDISIECKADGEPKPKISWLFSNGTIVNSEILYLNKLRSNKIVLTCIANNGIDDVLKKEITVLISGKTLIEMKR